MKYRSKNTYTPYLTIGGVRVARTTHTSTNKSTIVSINWYIIIARFCYTPASALLLCLYPTYMQCLSRVQNQNHLEKDPMAPFSNFFWALRTGFTNRRTIGDVKSSDFSQGVCTRIVSKYAELQKYHVIFEIPLTGWILPLKVLRRNGTIASGDHGSFFAGAYLGVRHSCPRHHPAKKRVVELALSLIPRLS